MKNYHYEQELLVDHTPLQELNCMINDLWPLRRGKGSCDSGFNFDIEQTKLKQELGSKNK